MGIYRRYGSNPHQPEDRTEAVALCRSGRPDGPHNLRKQFHHTRRKQDPLGSAKRRNLQLFRPQGRKTGALSAQKQLIGQLPHTEDYEICTLRPGNPLADRHSRSDTGSLQISPLHYQQAGCGRRRSVLGECITSRTYLGRLSQRSNPGAQRILPEHRLPFAKRTNRATTGKLRRKGHLLHLLRYQGKNMDRNQR